MIDLIGFCEYEKISNGMFEKTDLGKQQRPTRRLAFDILRMGSREKRNDMKASESPTDPQQWPLLDNVVDKTVMAIIHPHGPVTGHRRKARPELPARQRGQVPVFPRLAGARHAPG